MESFEQIVNVIKLIVLICTIPTFLTIGMMRNYQDNKWVSGWVYTYLAFLFFVILADFVMLFTNPGLKSMVVCN